MRKLLVMLLFVLVIGFGVVGYLQPHTPGQVVDPADGSVVSPA